MAGFEDGDTWMTGLEDGQIQPILDTSSDNLVSRMFDDDTSNMREFLTDHKVFAAGGVALIGGVIVELASIPLDNSSMFLGGITVALGGAATSMTSLLVVARRRKQSS